ncbi:MAG: hypothetical protein HQL76_06470 [Magnetococcales bacterium]|nr:hypothetical protein [Magnetococcales bacterium]
MGKIFFFLAIAAIVLAAPLLEQKTSTVYLPLNQQGKGLLSLALAPHVTKIVARPSEEMIATGVGAPLHFMILDKRTLNVYRMVVKTGEKIKAPWDGWIHPVVFVPDLVFLEGTAIHGPEGHVNPAVWIVLQDEKGNPFHESWVFSRDTAQTAWDHQRYDLTFLGPTESIEGDS